MASTGLSGVRTLSSCVSHQVTYTSSIAWHVVGFIVAKHSAKADYAENIAIVIIIMLTKLIMITTRTMTWCTVPGEREGEVKRAGYDNDNAIGDNVDK